MTLAELLRESEAPEGLSNDRLAALTVELFSAFDRISASTPGDPVRQVRQMDDLKHALSRCRFETDRRGQTPHLDAQREALSAAVNGLRNRGSAAVAAGAGVGVRSMASRMTRTRGRARPSPSGQLGQPLSRAAALRACGSSATAPGTVLSSSEELGRAMVEVLDEIGPSAFGRPGLGPIERRVATADWRDVYPAERRLTADPYRNTRKISAVCAPQAVVASGGICAPVTVDYTVPTWAVDTRPLRDGLPAFQADRGGISFVSPPDIGVPDLQATPASGLGSATRVWTEATDATPGAATKPVYTVTCGTEQTVYVNAVPTRLKFGNMQGRFAPEQIAANTDVALAAAAREAELELLTLMYGASKQVKASQYLGATRDLLASADLLAAQYRYSHRIPESSSLTAVFPAWAKALVRADLARELAHDNNNGRDVLAIDDDTIEQWFSARGIRVMWTMDGVKAGTYGTGGSALKSQHFTLLGSSAPTAAWPNQTTTGTVQLGWLLYAEGSFQFLDGGRLTLGVVRDSTLDATNDYETFVETFEGIAMRGIEAYQVQSTVVPTGGSAGTVAKATYHE